MSTDFLAELTWREMIHTVTPGTEQRLAKGPVTGYAGFDPTFRSLHIGHLIPITLLMHLQRSGSKPIALVGGATGMIGDPSGRSAERQLLSEEEVRHNVECIRGQLEKFLDFSCGETSARIVNNYDWFKDMNLLDFLRDVGKYLTVSYMMAKDSVQQRLEAGLSFTEFSYQLMQGYDFLHLYEDVDCELQLGGSDQWGNITAGTELIRRRLGKEAFALTCPLLTRSDGKKFGKSESGESVWLDPELTSPYRFFQYWLNCTDEDAPKMLRLFSLLSHEEIAELETQHAHAPQRRVLQRALARDLTVRAHSEADYEAAVEASQILFGKGTAEALKKLSENDLLAVFEGVPQVRVPRTRLEAGINAVELLATETGVFSSKGEARRMIAGGGTSLNKEKIAGVDETITADALLNNRYLILQKGKKNYYLLIAE